MNLVAHLVVAERLTGLGGDADEVLGAVLPDLAPMAGVRFHKPTLPEGVRTGVAIHHRTDARFHAHPGFVEAVRDDVAALQAAGVSRGASRASAHVGFELLLDGVLLRDDRVRASVGVLVDSLDVDRLGRLPPGEADAWSRLFARMRSGRLTDAYGSAEAVAERLEVVLARRPRLALDPTARPALVSRLALRRTSVGRDGHQIVEQVTGSVRRDSGWPGRAA